MNLCITLIALSSAALLPPVMPAADLAVYRDFHLGMPPVDVKKLAGIATAETRVISSRPNRIEELDWRVDWASAGGRPDPFSSLLFTFYDNELFQIEVTYDREKTAGLTDDDMVEAVSGIYGSATRHADGEITFNSGFRKSVKVIARWENDDFQLNLVRLPYEAGFGLALAARADRTKADQAILESARLDQAEAPQREAALRASRLADAQVLEEKARSLNKPGFRP